MVGIPYGLNEMERSGRFIARTTTRSTFNENRLAEVPTLWPGVPDGDTGSEPKALAGLLWSVY